MPFSPYHNFGPLGSCKDGVCLPIEEGEQDDAERPLYEIQKEEANRLWQLRMESDMRIENIVQERKAIQREQAYQLIHQYGGLIIKDTIQLPNVRPTEERSNCVLNVKEGEQGMFSFIGQELYVRIISVDQRYKTIRCEILSDAPNFEAGRIKNFKLGSEYWNGEEVLRKRGPRQADMPVRKFSPKEMATIALSGEEDNLPPESPRRKLVPRTVTQHMSPIWLRMLYDAIVEWIIHLRKPKWVRTLEMRDTLIDMAYADERGETEKAIELLHKLQQLHHERGLE